MVQIIAELSKIQIMIVYSLKCLIQPITIFEPLNGQVRSGEIRRQRLNRHRYRRHHCLGHRRCRRW